LSSLEISEEDLQIIKIRAFEKFNISIFIDKWYKFIKMTVEKHREYNTREKVNVDHYAAIKSLLNKHKTPRRIARKLNIMNFPLPEGEKEWTYTLVSKFL